MTNEAYGEIVHSFCREVMGDCPNLAGAGIAAGPTLSVMLVEEMDTSEFPTEYRGLPVTYRVTGRFYAQ